jgi:hypothetical protein
MIIGIRGSLCFTLKAVCFGNWFSEVSLFDWIHPSFQHPRQWRGAVIKFVLLIELFKRMVSNIFKNICIFLFDFLSLEK